MNILIIFVIQIIADNQFVRLLAQMSPHTTISENIEFRAGQGAFAKIKFTHNL